VTRLRNRIRKADYFTDGELLRWPRDKRYTYSGLWAIAEDSGCLEDDPFAWKLVLWSSPLDADITVELLTTWRDELVAAGKLVPYTADGKQFLYIRTFHQHEHPRNPQRPDLPLPPWIVCESVEGLSKDGKPWRRTQYTDTNSNGKPQYRQSTESVLGPPPRPAPSRVPKGTSGKGVGGKQPVDNVRSRRAGSNSTTSDSATVALTQGEQAIVDRDDLDRVVEHSWYAMRSGDRCYAASKVKGGVMLMHRFILDLGVDRDGFDVHHKNGDGLDNRRENLQKVNRSDHMLIHNAPQENGNSSVVCWRCDKPISADDRCDDSKCVDSRKGLRHVECAP